MQRKEEEKRDEGKTTRKGKKKEVGKGLEGEEEERKRGRECRIKEVIIYGR